MITENIKTQLKLCLKDYLDEIARKGKNGLYFNPLYNDTKASLSIDPKDPTYCKDFGNGKTYDIFSLYAEYNGLNVKNDFMRICDELAQHFNIMLDYDKQKTTTEIKKEIKREPQQSDLKEYYNRCNGDIEKSPEAIEYLKSRCLYDTDLIKKYNIGYDNGGHIKEYIKDFKIYEKFITIPCNDYYFKGRNIDKSKKEFKQINPKGRAVALWNYKNLYGSTAATCIFLTESITDALSIEIIDPTIKTIALNSTQNKKLLYDEIVKADYKGYFVLCLDADESGQKASQEIQKDLEKSDIFSLIVNDKYNCYYGEWQEKEKGIKDLTIKDFNEMLIKFNNHKEFIKSYIDLVKQEADEKQKDFIYKDLTPTSEYIKDLENEIENTTTYKPIKTNIMALDNALNGGLYAKNLIMLVADTSIGKTAFCLQVADTIAQNKPVLYFSLEMSQSELIARSISRYMYMWDGIEKRPEYNLNQIDILQGKQYNSIQIKELYDTAKKDYINQVKDNLYIYECLDDKENTITEITNKINKFIKKTNQKPVIFIDYLQYIDADEKNATDKQAIDKIIRQLKKIARTQAIPVFVISSTARANYGKETDIASGKSSGDIEYTADVLLGLNLEIIRDLKGTKNGGYTKDELKQIKNARKQNTRNIYLTIMKNRNGRRDIDINNIKFTPASNYFDFTSATTSDITKLKNVFDNADKDDKEFIKGLK